MGLEVSGISGVEMCYVFLMVYWVIALGFPIKRCDMMLYVVLLLKAKFDLSHDSDRVCAVLGLQHGLSKVVKYLTHTFCCGCWRGHWCETSTKSPPHV